MSQAASSEQASRAHGLPSGSPLILLRRPIPIASRRHLGTFSEGTASRNAQGRKEHQLGGGPRR